MCVYIYTHVYTHIQLHGASGCWDSRPKESKTESSKEAKEESKEESTESSKEAWASFEPREGEPKLPNKAY